MWALFFIVNGNIAITGSPHSPVFNTQHTTLKTILGLIEPCQVFV